PPRSTPFPYTTLFRSGVGLVVVRRGGEKTVAKRQDCGQRLERARGSEGMAVHGFGGAHGEPVGVTCEDGANGGGLGEIVGLRAGDRKSTRLNSSHLGI